MAIDLDGTLLHSDRTISERARSAIARLRAEGVDVMVCTGRPPRMVRSIAAELDLPRAIVFQGSATYHAEGDHVDVHRRVDPDVALQVLGRFRDRHPDALCALETEAGWYVDRALAEAQGLADLPPEKRPNGIGHVEDFVSDGVVKVLVRHRSCRAPTLAEAVTGLPVYHTWTTPDLLEVLSDGVNKQVALERYAREQGVSRERIAAFGDQHNDQEMLAWAGLGIAMANGSDEARFAADMVTGSNDDDGVATVLELWANGREGGSGGGARG